MAHEVKLPSGATLKITPGSFLESKNLYQALLSELKVVKLDKEIVTKMDEADLIKDLFCVGFSSPLIEAALWPCFKRCTYNPGKPGSADVRIDDATFEPIDAREDYIQVCVEVAKVNVAPFAKSLFASWDLAQAMGGITRA
jgi:hypothetical protein